MEIPYVEGKLNFIIYLHLTLDKVFNGGLIALHKLAFELADRGHNVYIFCEPNYPHPNIKVIPKLTESTEDGELYFWDQFSFHIDTTISIYPEIVMGNPINTKHVVRWILYHTQIGIEQSFGENDIYFNYCNFETFRNVPFRKLTVFDYNLDSLYITNTGERKTFCHILNKNTPPNGKNLLSELNSTDLSDWIYKGRSEKYTSFDFLREMFNQHEFFLTYDQRTYYAIMATLCGCKTIILNPGKPFEEIPNANTALAAQNDISPTEFRLKNYLQQYGIAYGWGDLKWAEDTIHLSRRYIQELKIIDDKTVDDFINFWFEETLKK